MKKLLLAIIVLIPVFVFGQATIRSKDSLTKYAPGLIYGVPTNTAPDWQYGIVTDWEFYDVSPTDTIPTLFLVCDTTRPQAITNQGFFMEQDRALHEYRGVWWMMGYEVLRYSSASVFDGGYQTTEVIARLDEKKKPILKSLVIWMTKQSK